MVNAQEWLDREYPLNQRDEITELNISGQNLEGGLGLHNFTNLEKLNCSKNELTELNISKCSKLVTLYCWENKLISLDLSNNNQLFEYYCCDNKLEQVILPFHYDLAACKEESEKFFDIASDEQLSNEVIEQIKNFNHKNLTSGQELLIEKLISDKERYEKFGLCTECKQIKNNSSFDDPSNIIWCTHCNARYFQQDFNKWSSGNKTIDKFIQEYQKQPVAYYKATLEWIPYEKFTNIEYLTEGGFGKIYKVKWINGKVQSFNNETGKWQRVGDQEVILKVLNNSQKTTRFLREIANHKFTEGFIIPCFGISREPETDNYIMVMKYAPRGDLRKYLQTNQRLSFKDKLWQIWNIVHGLKKFVHDKGLVHKDFHPGNILNDGTWNYITDLGLSQPVNETNQEEVYGVLPYVAPEVLLGKPYTQASDIYSFGVVVYEILSGLLPYHDIPHNTGLAIKICQGLRPDLDSIQAPQLLKNLVKQCLDADPRKRPTANELYQLLAENWTHYDPKKKVSLRDDFILGLGDNFFIKNKEFHKQYKEVEQNVCRWLFNKTISALGVKTSTSYQIHPQAAYTSKPINTKEIIRLFQGSEEQALEQEIKKIEREIEQTLTEEQKLLVSNFIQTKKLTIQDEEDEAAEDKVWELEDKLKDQGLSEEKINEITRYCERFIKAEQELEKERLETSIEIPTNQ